MAGSTIKTANIETGMPTADQAIRRMTFEIYSAQAQGCAALKVIHGYGSSGAGGRIRVEARKYLDSLLRRGKIRGFVTGEQFSIFDGDTRIALDLCPALRQDRDLERHNNGVTIILL